MTLKKLLFTGGGGSGNEAIYRFLSKNYETHFADAEIEEISPSIPENLCHKIPYATSPDFVKKLNKLCYIFHSVHNWPYEDGIKY